MARAGLVPALALTALVTGLGWGDVVAAQEQRAADEVAIRELVRQYVDARERRDPKAIGELFVADADQLTSSGEWRTGRDDVVRGALASSARNEGRRTIEIERIRYPASGVAIADGRYAITTDGGSARRMWTAFVLTRQAEGWRIAAIRNMLPSAQPASTPSAR